MWVSRVSGKAHRNAFQQSSLFHLPSLISDLQVPISETVALKYFRDVVKGLEYLHFNRIVHGDLKVRTAVVIAFGLLQRVTLSMAY